MLAGEEERSCWQVEEKSENSDGYKGYVYYTGHIHGEKLQEIKLDQRGHAVTLTTHTHTPHTHTHARTHTHTHTCTHTHRRAEGHGASAAKRWSTLTLWHCSWR